MKKSSAHSRTKSAQRVTNSSLRRLPIFSLDVGYGYTKIMDSSGAHHIFPSLVAPGDIGSIDLGIASAACPAVFLDGVEYIVGENAATREFRFVEQYDSWWTSVRFRAIIQYASKFIAPKAHVMTGLPLHIYSAVKAHQQIRDVLRRGLHAEDITILPQGVGAYCAAAAQDPQLNEGRVGLIDIGTRTTELVCFSDGQFLAKSSAGLIIGVGEVFAQVANRLAQQHNRPVDAYEVDWAFRGIRPLRIKGEVIPANIIANLIQPCIKPLTERLFNEITHLWGDGAPNVDRLVFCGGGVPLVEPYLGAYRPSYQVLKDSQFANAMGYFQYARWQEARHGYHEAASPERTEASANDSRVGETEGAPIVGTPA